jgi:hypothetical protein
MSVTRAIARRQTRQLLFRRSYASTAQETAGAAKEKAQATASKAQEGLSRVTSSAGNVLTKAGGALGSIGGRTGRLIGFVSCMCCLLMAGGALSIEGAVGA